VLLLAIAAAIEPSHGRRMFFSIFLPVSIFVSNFLSFALAGSHIRGLLLIQYFPSASKLDPSHSSVDSYNKILRPEGSASSSKLTATKIR
jgi:hypothetical protein